MDFSRVDWAGAPKHLSAAEALQLSGDGDAISHVRRPIPLYDVESEYNMDFAGHLRYGAPSSSMTPGLDG
jgi:hypothetical protein